MRAYPMLEGDQMPEHDLVWVTEGVDDGPERVILEAMKATPELWLHALPPEVCIVPRKSLETLGLNEDIVGLLVEQGAFMVMPMLPCLRNRERITKNNFYAGARAMLVSHWSVDLPPP